MSRIGLRTYSVPVPKISIATTSPVPIGHGSGTRSFTEALLPPPESFYAKGVSSHETSKFVDRLTGAPTGMFGASLNLVGGLKLLK